MDSNKVISKIKLNTDTTANASGFNLRDFLIKYIKYLPLIILGVVSAYVLAKLKLRYTNSVYQASGTMIVKEEKKGAGDTKAIEELFTSSSGNDLATEIEYMKSRKLMRSVVNSLNLQHSYLSKGKVKTTLLYEQVPIQLVLVNNVDTSLGLSIEIKVINANQFQLKSQKELISFNQEINVQNKTIKIVKTESFSTNNMAGQKYIINWQPMEKVSGDYSSAIKVSTVNEITRILKVSMEGESPKLCVDVVNQLMMEYIKDNKQKNQEVSEFTKSFINERVKDLAIDLKDIENNVKEFRRKNNTINVDAQSTIYLADLNTAQKELTKELVYKNIASSVLTQFENDPNVKEYAPAGLFKDANIDNLLLQFNELQIKRKQTRLTETNEGFAYEDETKSVKQLRVAIMQAISKLISISATNVQNLEKTVNENIAKLKNVPGIENELLNYGRNQKIVEELYLFLKKKGEEAGITSASTISNSSILDPALVNNAPIAPIPSKTLTLAIFLGLLIPAGIAYIIELFNDKVRYRDDIEKQTNTPIIAEVGHNDEQKTLVVTSRSRRVIAEQFRMIRTNLQYLVGAKEKFTVLVTSSFSGEGKSFISTNVAAALSLTGKKTVLLEFDLRKPKVLEGLGMIKGAGISNFVVGKAELKDIIKPVDGYDNLFVIGCGAIPPNPAELLLENNINVLFEYLQNNFDAVVIDSAPVGLVTDSMTLSKFTDATLYIVRHKYTLKKQIRLIDELYTSDKLPKLSIVINDVVGGTGGYYGYGGYGYGYGYGRSYGYGYGYFEETKRNRLKELWQKIVGFLLFWK